MLIDCNIVTSLVRGTSEEKGSVLRTPPSPRRQRPASSQLLRHGRSCPNGRPERVGDVEEGRAPVGLVQHPELRELAARRPASTQRSIEAALPELGLALG